MCSKGTYIRSLARDLGVALGCGAHLTRLVRTRIGEYRVEDAYSLEAIEALRPPRPEGEGPARPRRERPATAPNRAGLQYFAALQADALAAKQREEAGASPPEAARVATHMLRIERCLVPAHRPLAVKACSRYLRGIVILHHSLLRRLMHVIRDPAQFPFLGNAVVTSGTFDGVHVGHQRILARLREVAQASGGPAVVITYWPHPRLVLGPPPSHPELLELQLLNTLDERIAKLAEFGVDYLLIVPFTREFAQWTSEEYIQKLLLKTVGAKQLVIGYDHRFGKNREGGFDYLQPTRRPLRPDAWKRFRAKTWMPWA